MWRFNLALQSQISRAGSIRALARKLNVGASILSRFAAGETQDLDGHNAKLLGESLGICPTCDSVWPGAKSATAWVLTTGDSYWTGQTVTAMSRELDEAIRFPRLEDADRVRTGLIAVVDKSLADRLGARLRFWSGEQF
jgi:hypothetical protein